MQGWRKTMEDTHIARIEFTKGMSLFGVFDGHGGTLFLRDSFIIRRSLSGDVLLEASSF